MKIQITLKTTGLCTGKVENEKKKRQKMPPVRFELTTPGLRDQCSATEL